MKKWKNEETNNGALFKYRTSQLSVHSANIVRRHITSIFNNCVPHTRNKFKIQHQKENMIFCSFLCHCHGASRVPTTQHLK